jgi:S1-C subfamily serine protease
MKTFVSLACALLVASTAFAADWLAVAKTIRESIVEISIGEKGACTGGVIDDARDNVLTAAHCDNTESGKDLFVDGKPAKVKFKDIKTDLMVLFVDGIDRPALSLAKHDPEVGEEIASYGFGWNLEKPLFRVGHISVESIALEGYERAQRLGIDASFVGGQSGGPVINAAGEIVMVVQLTNPEAGWGVGAEVIADKVGKYFTK